MNGDFAHLLNHPPKRYGGILALPMRNHPEILDRPPNDATHLLSAGVS
jgi:hypothetical protein